ncbi:restriction endonuclease subunit S domain-containing protein [Archangium violaceum]|uniref:hypothetical protein n=1 Tax=Archangium violaceum TaxID=83451 RepID=UPI0036DBED29
MSFPRYPEYKDSSVEWLGEVPSHWEIKKLKHVSPELTVGIVVEPSRLYAEEGVPALRSLNVKAGAISLDNLVFITQAGHEFHSKSRLRAGDIVAVRTGQPGASAVVPQELDGCNCIDLIVIRRPTIGSEQFLCWYLGSEPALLQFSIGSGGAIQQHFNISTAAELIVAVPPLAEQTAIAAFIGRETGKIDALVAEQRRLIELLNEKRQAVISHAVTRGLAPNVAMRASDIEWLPEVPAHWRTVQVKHLARLGEKTFTDGDWIEAPYITNEGVRLIQTGNVGVGVYKEQGFRFVSASTFEELGCTEVEPRDVLICRLDGPVGRACLAPDLGGRMITSVDNTILKVAEEVAPEFMVALFSSVPWLAWIDALCRVGGGFRLRVSRSQLGELRVPLPPLSEQISIARYLDSQAAKWAALAAESQRAIDLLQERRAALISAAVTGQIDVRAIANRVAA